MSIYLKQDFVQKKVIKTNAKNNQFIIEKKSII